MLLTTPSLSWCLGYALAAAILYYVCWQLTVGARRRALSNEYACKPIPSLPMWDRFMGIDHFLEILKADDDCRVLDLFDQRFQHMGVNTFSTPVLGRMEINTIEPDNLKAIQALNFKDWALPAVRSPAFGPLIGPGIFTANGHEWQHSRDLLRPNFVRSQVADTATYDTHIQHLIDAIPRDGQVVDLQDLFFRLTMDTATELLMGESTNCLAPGLTTVSNDRFAAAWSYCMDIISKWNVYGAFGFLVKSPDFTANAKYVQDFVDTHVDRALARRPALLAARATDDKARYVFLDELVCQTTDRYRIRSELLHILLAGRDTTASLLSNVFWTLSRRPDLYAELRAEVAAAANPSASTPDPAAPPLLRAVLAESLRLHPVVPLNSREAVRDTVLPLGGGPDGRSPCLIRKGWHVVWSLWSMHRRADLHGADARAFRPRRWLEPRPPGWSAWHHLPFNGGPRACLGRGLALAEAEHVAARLVREFDQLRAADTEPWRERLALTCTGAGGCRVVAVP